jgi:hypothetical protein
MAAIYEAALHFRRQLLAVEDVAALRLLRAYDGAWLGIQSEIDQLLARIQAEGVRSPAWIFQRARLQALQDQIARAVAELAELGASETALAQSRVVALAEERLRELAVLGLGADRAVAELTAALPQFGLDGLRAEIASAFTRLPDEALRAFVGFAGDGSPLAGVFRRRADEWGGVTARAIEGLLGRGIAQGWNPRRTAAAILSAIEDRGGNPEKSPRLVRDLERIARTETMRAYREASHQSFLANQDVMEGWVWLAALGARTCLGCVGKHGRLFPADVRMESHPNCRCVQVPRTKSFAELLGERGGGLPDTRPDLPQSGEDWFRALPKERQLKIAHPAVVEAFRDGYLEFGDLWRTTTSERWGESVGAVSAKEALGEALARYEERAARYARRENR